MEPHSKAKKNRRHRERERERERREEKPKGTRVRLSAWFEPFTQEEAGRVVVGQRKAVDGTFSRLLSSFHFFNFF